MGFSPYRMCNMGVFCQFLRRLSEISATFRFKSQAACELTDGSPGMVTMPHSGLALNMNRTAGKNDAPITSQDRIKTCRNTHTNKF